MRWNIKWNITFNSCIDKIDKAIEEYQSFNYTFRELVNGSIKRTVLHKIKDNEGVVIKWVKRLIRIK